MCFHDAGDGGDNFDLLFVLLAQHFLQIVRVVLVRLVCHTQLDFFLLFLQPDTLGHLPVATSRNWLKLNCWLLAVYVYLEMFALLRHGGFI